MLTQHEALTILRNNPRSAIMEAIGQTILDHLKAGGKLVDYTQYKAGKCTNGGCYSTTYRMVDGEIWSLSSYEDAEGELVATADEAESWAKQMAEEWPNSECWHYPGELAFALE